MRADNGMNRASTSADIRLATYGTLAPGRTNHGQLADLEGRWRKGIVRGRLVQDGWGAELGYPGIILDPLGDAVQVDLFESNELPDHWRRLDAFEGDGYLRTITEVQTNDEVLEAFIYVIRS